MDSELTTRSLKYLVIPPYLRIRFAADFLDLYRGELVGEERENSVENCLKMVKEGGIKGER